jgi:hypothetical protein
MYYVIMRPGEKGELILQDSEERRLMLVGADLISEEHPELKQHLTERESDSLRFALNGMQSYVENAGIDISRPSRTLDSASFRVLYKHSSSEIRIDPSFAPLAVKALTAVANLSRVQAIKYMVSRPWARDILVDYEHQLESR